MFRVFFGSLHYKYESLKFESLKYSPSDNNEVILLDEACDPDSSFYNVNAQKLDTPYIPSEEFPILRISTVQNDFSILQLNIRSIQKFFENLKLFLCNLNFNFSVMCFWKHSWIMTLCLLLNLYMNCLIIKAFIKFKIIVKEVEFQFI